MDVLCDVIIPIYNAFNVTVNCIETVVKNTDLKKDRLILINDCSTDRRVSRYLAFLKEKLPQLDIIVIENQVNLGFVKTVNIGMKYSKRDVLLLNSDTLVGSGWLSKIKRCAYSQKRVGTVTALSNNATLASVPKCLEKNEIPVEINLDQYNKILETCGYRDYPEIPTAHGFCMYIRRNALDVLGFFDEKSFGRGYCEENDFSFRCADYGFKNLLCDDTIVYHFESQSFLKEREQVLSEHQKILKERYPARSKALDNWCASLPVSYIGKNIELNLKLRRKHNILILIHEWSHALGGTTLHVKDIISSLCKFFNFHVLYPGQNGYELESFFQKESVITKLPFEISRNLGTAWYNKDYRDMLEQIVKAFSIQEIHIHHLKGHYFDVADIAQKCKIKSIITLHDYFSLCPSVNMLYCDEKYCEKISQKDCGACLVKTGRAANNIVAEWRFEWQNFLLRQDKIIAPSQDTKSRICKFFKNIDITVIEHGINFSKTTYKPLIDKHFRVAFVGVVCRHKGGDIINSLVAKNTGDCIEFHIFGKSEYSELEKSRRGYKYHGEYKREELAFLLQKNKINLVCFLQIWPETYSYTVNEAVAAGIPVLSFDIGAGAQRIKDGNLGWLLSVDCTVDEIMKKIIFIKNNPKIYQNAICSVQNYKFKSVLEMAEEYRQIYATNSPIKIPDAQALRGIVKLENLLQHKKYHNDDASKKILCEILNSAKWKIVSKIKIPKFVSTPLKRCFCSVKRLFERKHL